MLMIREVVPNLLCGLRNQSSSTPSSATRFRTPLAPMIDVFTAPRQNQRAHHHDESVEHEPQQLRPGQVHRQAADQVVGVVLRPSPRPG